MNRRIRSEAPWIREKRQQKMSDCFDIGYYKDAIDLEEFLECSKCNHTEECLVVKFIKDNR